MTAETAAKSETVTAEPTTTPGTVAELMRGIGRSARAAARVLALADTGQKNLALRAGAAALRAQRSRILAANEGDLREAEACSTSGALLDRLRLDDGRVEAMARGLEDIERLEDPIGRHLADWRRPNGLGSHGCAYPWG